jgi:hypothetical protein
MKQQRQSQKKYFKKGKGVQNHVLSGFGAPFA